MTANPRAANLFSRRLDFAAAPNRLAALEAGKRARGAPLLDLCATNPTAVGLPYPTEAIARALAEGAAAAYEPAPFGLPAARAAVAQDLGRLGAEVDPARVVLTASSSESYALLAKLLCDPGDEILVPRPSYPLFDHLLGLEGVRPRPYSLAFDGAWHVDFGGLDPGGARALVAVNPNNPTGSFLAAGELDRLHVLAARHDLALVADEVFADYAFAAAGDAVRTVTTRPAPCLTFALGGLSKSCGLPHLKLGWIAVLGPEPAARAALDRLELIADAYLSVATPFQRALPRLLELGAGVRAAITARVADNRARLAAAFGPGSAVTRLPAEGGWAAILRLPATRTDEEWALELLEEDDVLVQPGYFYDLELPACVILSALTPPGAFAEGIARIAARAAT